MTEKKESHSNYKGFVAGVFSGIAKLTGMLSSYFDNSILRFQAERVLDRCFSFNRRMADMREVVEIPNIPSSRSSLRYDQSPSPNL